MELAKTVAYKSEDQAGDVMGKGFDQILRTHKGGKGELTPVSSL